MYEKLVVTKGIFLPQPLHHSEGIVVGKKNLQTPTDVSLTWDKDKILPSLGDAKARLHDSEIKKIQKKTGMVTSGEIPDLV